MKKRIAIVVQRYGLEVNGGAELHARLLAERLSAYYEVDVLTTTALNYSDWENYYPPGSAIINGVQVKRFSTIKSTDRELRRAQRAIWGEKKYFKKLKKIGLLDFLDRKFSIRTPTQKDILYWLKKQGPYCPDMIKYIKANRDHYDTFIFFTYLYYPTAVGMRLVAEKSIFIPTAHDEAIMFTKPYEDIFGVPAFIMYNTLAERDLIENRFKKVARYSDIAGVGVTPVLTVDDVSLVEELNISKPFFVYIGRIDSHKGCDQLVLFFERYAEQAKNIKLVMVGKDYMGVKKSEHIFLTGFVDDSTKNSILKSSLALIIPSEYESLSMVTLEAMAEGKSVIVNEKSEVLKSHVLNSQTGFYYNSYEDFKSALDAVLALTENDKAKISEHAKAYVRKNYDWDTIIEKFKTAIQNICDGKYK